MGRFERKSEAFKKAAVDRMKSCPNICELCEELGISRRALYGWKGKVSEGRPKPTVEQRLRRENEKLKRALAEEVLKVDFCKGALRKIEERRRSSSGSGTKTSTPKCEQ